MNNLLPAGDNRLPRNPSVRAFSALMIVIMVMKMRMVITHPNIPTFMITVLKIDININMMTSVS